MLSLFPSPGHTPGRTLWGSLGSLVPKRVQAQVPLASERSAMWTGEVPWKRAPGSGPAISHGGSKDWCYDRSRKDIVDAYRRLGFSFDSY